MIDELIGSFDNNTMKVVNRDKIELSETGSQNVSDLKKCYVSLENNNQVVLIKSDRVEFKKIFHKDSKQNSKRCDYIILKDKKAYFIELKTTYRSDNIEDYSNQFIGSVCISEYIDSVIENFFRKKRIFKNIEKRFILICKNFSIHKYTMNDIRELSDERNDKPDKFRIIQVDNDGVIAVEELG